MSFLDRFIVREKTESPDTLSRRLGKVPTGDLSGWIENTVSDVGRSAHRYTIERDPDKAAAYLEEAKIGASSLVSLIDELERRTS